MNDRSVSQIQIVSDCEKQVAVLRHIAKDGWSVDIFAVDSSGYKHLKHSFVASAELDSLRNYCGKLINTI